jgi:FlaA1/EpsC-like NDP-sugar epimerase
MAVISQAIQKFRVVALNLPRPIKQILVAGVDILMSVAAVWLAYVLRLDAFRLPRTSPQLIVYLLAPALLIIIFWRLGVYREIFRYTGISIIKTLSQGILFQALAYGLALWILSLLGIVRFAGYDLPRSILVLAPLLTLTLCSGVRAIAYQALTGFEKSRRVFRNRSRLLIYGAGSAGIQAYEAIKSSSVFAVLGFIDDNVALQGREIQGNRIFAFADLQDIIPRMGVSDIILAMPSLSRSERVQILQRLRAHPVHVRSLPNLDDLASGHIQINDVKELDITDLLGRTTVQPDTELINSSLVDRVVLITGAGGSIGGELCRQIIKTNPVRLVLLDVSEYALYRVEQELSRLKSLGRYAQGTQIVALLGSVRDELRMNEILGYHRPHTIFHAAAYKHVPLVETNPFEGIRNNVYGTRVLGELAKKHRVANFVLISTDKAVRPTNIMGASKRLAELVLQALTEESRESKESSEFKDTVFSIVRFGNVLGSSGSVVPLFRQQILEGGPITLTDFEVTRYFMTIPEAAQLVIQASAMAKGGEVFVLDMGEPVKIYDLACRMVELSGLKVKSKEQPSGDIEIIRVGLRPGEKLFEELLIGDNPSATQHPRIMQAREAHLKWHDLVSELNTLEQSMKAGQAGLVIEQLKTLVSGFVPDVRSW